MFKTCYFILSPGLKLDFWATWWWLTGWRERFRPSGVDFYSQMAFSDCKTELSLNLELKRVKGNFIWSLVLALIFTLISALTLSLKFILKLGQRDSPLSFDENDVIFGHILQIFSILTSEIMVLDYMSLLHLDEISLHPVNHHYQVGELWDNS